MAIKKKFVQTQSTAEDLTPKFTATMPVNNQPAPTPNNPLGFELTKPVEKPTPPPIKQGVETFKSADTGRPSGVSMPDGRVFFGLNADDIKTIVSGEQKKEQIPGTQPVGTAAALNEQARQGAALQNKIGVLPPEQMQQKSMGEDVLTTGLSLGAIAGGAGTGAAAGALVGGPIGAVAGGIIGGASALFGKLTLERRQDVKVAKANFDNAKASLSNLRNLALTNPELRESIIKQWNDNLVVIRSSERALREQNKTLVGKKLADNLDELADIEQFYRDYPLLYELQFRNSIMGVA